MKLNLGVLDVAYSQDGQITTTGFVAEILEGNYHVMQVFFELHGEEIADSVAAELMGAMETSKINGQMNLRELVVPEIHALFAEYLETGEYVATSGVTVEAAENGYRSSHKSVTANNKGPRAAFIDTHLYKDSMEGWITP